MPVQKGQIYRMLFCLSLFPHVFKGMDIFHTLLAIFTKDDNFCDLFAFLYMKSLLPLNGRICYPGRNFFPFKSKPLLTKETFLTELFILQEADILIIHHISVNLTH